MHHVTKTRNVSRQFNNRSLAREHFQAVISAAGAAKSRMIYGAVAAMLIGLIAAAFTMGAGLLIGIVLLVVNSGIYIVSRLAGGIAAKMLAEMED